MPLIVETGAGIAGADSYNTVEELDIYHANTGNTAWAATPTATKEARARRAAFTLDGDYEGRLTGVRVVPSQARAFPRYNCMFRDGVATYFWGTGLTGYGLAVPFNAVPSVWKQAHAALALFGDELGQPIRRNDRAHQVIVGTITVVHDAYAPVAPVYPDIERILFSLLRSSNAIRRC
jgi:hypothetical protein